MKITNTTIKPFLPMVRSIARRLHEELPLNIDLDDLISSGTIGLIEAMRSFDSERKVPFTSYARFRIRGSMLDALRTQDYLSRGERQYQKAVEAVTRKLATELQRVPTDHEIAAAVGCDIVKLRTHTPVTFMSLTAPIDKHDADGDCMNHPDRDTPNPEHLYRKLERNRQLWAAVAQLRPRWQQAINLYFGEDLTMRKVALAMGVNESRVSQIIKEATESLAQILRGTGVSTIRKAAAA